MSPTAMIDPLIERLQSALKPLIILSVCTAMSCVCLAYLIDRFLNQLDAGEFTFTKSIIFLLVILAGLVTAIILNLRSLTSKQKESRKKLEQERSANALETAFAALIMSYVDERNEKRKSEQTQNNEARVGL